MIKDLTVMEQDAPDLIKNISTGLIPKELQNYVAPALEEFRNEMAAELGLLDYENTDKGDLPSRVNGNVGGNMTSKMVKFAEAVLAWNYKNRLMLKG
ncbi:MAG: alpha/beta-type small acid-soluble spore protein [Desulfotomaculaceae bacterium]